MATLSTGITKNPWELYDRLIEGIPAGIGVKNWSVGRRWSHVESECGTGVAMALGDSMHLGRNGDPLRNDAIARCTLDLKGFAALVRSWNFDAASVGTAALNAFYNTPKNNPDLRAFLEATGQRSTAAEATGQANTASLPIRQDDIIATEIRACPGGNVTVIGHFPYLDKLADGCELTILERNPVGTDLPDPACEYVLPEQDLVIITGTALTNKTIMRLLELSRDARTVLVGPSCTCSAVLFEHGVDLIGGAVVADTDEARLLVSHGTHLPFGHGLEMIRFSKRSAD
jgi:uncharacterized protein (DUF4213/DUF364 family)